MKSKIFLSPINLLNYFFFYKNLRKSWILSMEAEQVIIQLTINEAYNKSMYLTPPPQFGPLLYLCEILIE